MNEKLLLLFPHLEMATKLFKVRVGILFIESKKLYFTFQLMQKGWLCHLFYCIKQRRICVFLHSHYIHIFTDGASLVHKGKVGGWSAIILFREHKKEISDAVPVATNNQMELLACIKALEQIKTIHIPIKVYSDSAYVIDGMNDWIYKWQLNGWKTNKNDVKNRDLWEQLISLSEKQDDIEFVKVKGHAGNIWNEKADELATNAIDKFLGR